MIEYLASGKKRHKRAINEKLDFLEMPAATPRYALMPIRKRQLALYVTCFPQQYPMLRYLLIEIIFIYLLESSPPKIQKRL